MRTTSPIQAVMQTRTEQGAVAWAIALNTIPVVAVPAWFVFGSNEIDAYHSAMRVGMDEVRTLAEKLIKNLDQAAADIQDNEGHGRSAFSGDHSEVLSRLETIGSLPVMAGNSAKLLVDGAETFDAIHDAISEAQDYILIQFYIFRDDGTGKRIRDSLVERAREGVSVYLLVDNLGSKALSADFIESITAPWDSSP